MKQYQELVRNILENGTRRPNRTGIDTISIFGAQSRYNMRDGFPLLTTKKVNFKAIVAELLWFLSGSTNTNDLDSKIWDEWADEDGNLGPIYGHQWRHWGGAKRPGGILLPNPGFDQIQNAIDTIKRNPDSRRIIVSAWNPDDIQEMALPPCHLMFQFNVRAREPGDTALDDSLKGYLDCQMYQRSADVALGVPYNIASYALLTRLIAQECDLAAGEFIHTMGDAHAYVNHIEGLQEQLTRKPRVLPRLLIGNVPFSEIKAEHIELLNYNPHDAIKFKVAV